jgi:hypothetical protein
LQQVRLQPIGPEKQGVELEPQIAVVARFQGEMAATDGQELDEVSSHCDKLTGR